MLLSLVNESVTILGTLRRTNGEQCNSGGSMNQSIVLLPKDFGHDLVEQIRVIKQDPSIQTSGDAYNQFFNRFGSWSSWIEHVAKGRDYLSQQPLYSRFYCVTTDLGRANADIVKKALNDGKDCEFFDGKEFFSIIGINQVSDDWTSGWEISYI